MAELIYSIKNIFNNYSIGKEFNIPEYQRGYKWSEQQVEQLLNDIKRFSLNKVGDSFYCLQNITLFQNKTNIDYLNVVDGQQRLTTIILLLSYLKQNQLVKDKINYAVRDTSNEFLQKVINTDSDLLNEVIVCEDFERFINSRKETLDFQDIFFMFNAIRTINNWFESNQDIVKTKFKETVLNDVKFIVNKIDTGLEQELFMNLNTGKVHLDGADLIRAILITRVAKQELENSDNEDVQDIVKLNQRRTRIGWELDEINQWWSKENAKNYFQNFTTIKTGSKETIEFNQNLHPINLLYKIWSEINSKNDIKLQYFEEGKALNVYNSILELHRILVDWFNDRRIYHFLGFLFAHKKIKIKLVYKIWKTKEVTRDVFVNQWCVETIKNSVFGPGNDEVEESGLNYWLKKITDFDNPTNWFSTNIIQEVLVLLDIIEHSKIKEKGNPLPFLKPLFFRNNKEDKEHIFSGTPNELGELKNLEKPIESLNYYINSLNEGYKDEQHLDPFNYSEEEWREMLEEDQSIALNEFKQLIHNKRPVNSLGNLVLLHLTINRGFGNNAYPSKRSNVIQNTVNGLYVRHHTMNVFLKNTNSENLNNWTLNDVKRNAESIHQTLVDFFKFKSNE